MVIIMSKLWGSLVAQLIKGSRLSLLWLGLLLWRGFYSWPRNFTYHNQKNFFNLKIKELAIAIQQKLTQHWSSCCGSAS